MTFRPRHILFPTDLSEPSWSALDAAHELARALGAKVTILFVIDEPEYYSVSSFYTASILDQDLETLRSEALDRARANMVEHVGDRFHGLELQQEVVFHHRPAVAIREFAEKNECELIVMASHGRSGLDRFFLGSTAEQVTRHSGRPTLLVPSS